MASSTRGTEPSPRTTKSRGGLERARVPQAGGEQLTRGKQEPADDDGREHDDHESNIDASLDLGQSRVGLQAERDGRTDEGTELEDGPEDGERSTLVLLEGIRHHDGTLRRPEESGS